ncbi:MAG: HlyD family efflux transporter periplasmic adaptor subunit [Gammaproteobacteria bacterium]|nr:HlyD family efflux transporter periplasmic adaptor subunit [Gammaproteobacteria bacterium]
MPTLFRKEVLEAQRQRLHGDVLIVTPLPLAVITGWLLVTLLGLGTLAVFGTYARSERVQGYLVPSGGLVKVAPARAGVLREVRVRVREEVAAGQVLAVVRSEALSLTGDTAASIALESLRDQERLLEGQIRLERDRLTRERLRLEAEGDGVEAQIASFEEQRELQREITETARSAFTRATALLEAGFVSVVESEARKQSWLAHHLEEKRQAQRLTELRARLTGLRHRLAMVPPEVALRVSRLESQAADIKQREAELEGRRAYVVKAPVTGTVASIKDTPGVIVSPHRPLASIRPAGSELEAELYVPSRAAGFVAAGQVVRLLYAAFPHQRFGSYEGVIRHVAPAITSVAEADVPFSLGEPCYRVAVRLGSQSVMAFGHSFELQAGMLLEGNIILERRSFLGWLTEPFRAVRH